MFKNQPKGLFALALANTGERFGYYTMLAVFVLFLKENFGLSEDQAGDIYATFLACVYFLPFIGGILADKFGYGKMVTTGILTMFAGYVLLAWPLGTGNPGMYAMYGALALISIGTGLFKGNLQVMVGNLYDDPKYSHKRDAAFSLFYMAINLGSLFAPSAASAMTRYAQEAGWAETLGEAYHFAFAVACVSLIFSILIYLLTRRTFKHVENGTPKAKTANTNSQQEEEKDTKSRIIALCLVFAVVIFFWMAFHQNGLTLTFFAEQFTNLNATEGFLSMSFNVWNLVLVIIAVYAGFSVVQSESVKSKIMSTLAVLACVAGLVAIFIYNSPEKAITAEMFQQFNPFYVVALTPVSMAIFGWLANRGKEPSAPRKIALGMLVAGIGFGVLTYGSMGLNTPAEQKKSQIVADASNFAIQLDSLNNARTLALQLDSIQRDSILPVQDSIIKNVNIEKEKYIVKLQKNDSIRLAEAKGDSIDLQDLQIAYFNKSYAATTTALANNEDLATLNLAEITNTKSLVKNSPYWLIIVYLILTFAELLLSPMGISFVSKVAPAKYKGMMMGGWFVATAIGNYLTKIGSMFWGDMPLWGVWTIFVACCLLSAIFMFAVMKKLEKVTK